MSALGRPPRIQVPRWVQLVGLPLLLILAWVFLTAASHVVFLFLVAGLVALLLDPLVRALQRVRLPRGLSVAIVLLAFASALVLVIVAIATAVVGETKTAANRFNEYFTNRSPPAGQTAADRDVDRLQRWLNTHHLKGVDVSKRGHRIVRQIQQRDIGKNTKRIISFVEGAAI
jgi:predicted PurR-regulated permease PerM